MRGLIPKPVGLRQRRNRVATSANLPAEGTGQRRAPPLPQDREWRDLTRAWWRDVWHSPMAGEYLKADVHGLYILAELVDAFWENPTTTLAAEIRQHRTAFGLTPIDRRRLQWEVEKVESATRKRQPTAPERKGKRTTDPRSYLRVI